MEHYDAIIIGSGAGGMATAVCLARAGQKVLVLEQHYVPGGWCHSFFIKGQRFSPGVHYVGLVDKGQSLNQLYEGLGVANDIVFFRMNRNGYEHCWIGNERIDMPAGKEELCKSLTVRFPKEERRLKKYLALVRTVSIQLQRVQKMYGFWDNVTIPFRTRYMGKYALFSLKRVINWHIKDPLLKAVLNVQCGDHGLPPFKASFLLHCAVMDHYLEGGFYPMGGGAGIVKAMVSAFKKHGGEIRTRQNVKKILVENHRAVGVELEDGQRITAATIVSNADPSMTYLQLVGKEHISSRLAKRLAKTTWSVTSLILFLTLNMDVKAAGLDSGNIWMLNDRDIDRIYYEMIGQELSEGEQFPAVFISCTTLKDPASFNGSYHNLEVVTYVSYDSFSAFHDTKDYHGDVYTTLKERIMEKMMNNVEKILPGAKNHVVQIELGTPMTNRHYINGTNGNVYGTEKTLNQIGPFSYKNKSEIGSLFLCGASTLSHGVGRATHSGIEAAAKILKCRPHELLISDKDQNLRIYDAEDPATWPDWISQKRTDRKRRFKSFPG